jgi:hypothetical protein
MMSRRVMAQRRGASGTSNTLAVFDEEQQLRWRRHIYSHRLFVLPLGATHSRLKMWCVRVHATSHKATNRLPMCIAAQLRYHSVVKSGSFLVDRRPCEERRPGN